MEESKQNSALQRYQTQLEASGDRVAQLKMRDARFGTIRLCLFALSLLSLMVAYFSAVGLVGWIIGIGLFAAFFVAAVLNEPIRDELDRENRSAEITKRLIARIERNWDALGWKSIEKKLTTVQFEEHQKDVADDLDLLGRSSLFQLISMAGTTAGVRTLANWLTAPADADQAKARQDAIETAGAFG